MINWMDHTTHKLGDLIYKENQESDKLYFIL